MKKFLHRLSEQNTAHARLYILSGQQNYLNNNQSFQQINLFEKKNIFVTPTIFFVITTKFW